MVGVYTEYNANTVCVLRGVVYVMGALLSGARMVGVRAVLAYTGG